MSRPRAPRPKKKTKVPAYPSAVARVRDLWRELACPDCGTVHLDNCPESNR